MNIALTIASATLIVRAVNIRKRWPRDGSAGTKVRRVKEANGGCSRKGEDKGFENEHREDTLLVVNNMTRETSYEKLLLTVVKIPADNPTLSTINSISLEHSN